MTNENIMDQSELLCCSKNNNNHNDTYRHIEPFPGVYFSLITKDNVENEILYQGRYVWLFSCELLKQKNYHINLRDHHGILSENNTFYPWNIEKVIERIKLQKTNQTQRHLQLKQTKQGKDDYMFMNEVVFHDPISMKYNVGCIDTYSLEYHQKYNNRFLPREKLTNQALPDLEKLPFLVYPFEEEYRGIYPPRESSLNWFQKMAEVCNINPEDMTREEILEKIKERMDDLRQHREKQNLSILMKK